MGKRKSARKPQTKKKVRLDVTFQCLLCNHEDTVTVTMDKPKKIGTLRCKVCNAGFQAVINHLSDPVDVYSDWVDACSRVNRDDGYAGEPADDGYGEADEPRHRDTYEEPRHRDEYGVPAQLSENESDLDDF
ncbi:hypothetical protein IWW50_000073 [Coemansia erecta]|nr:hypothetical protein GGF43_000637 [Coemansia sp. RSA 2618]KAJ2830757.1 hypothetical protein IWW50_000073 [Coemansia erecta]